MSKLPKKIRLLKFREGIRNRQICAATGAGLSTVFKWTSHKYCPPQIDRRYADSLVANYPEYITLRDCGYE